jgi:hypothetical protein
MGVRSGQGGIRRASGTGEAARASSASFGGVNSRAGGWRGPRLACLQTIYPAVIPLCRNLLRPRARGSSL